MDKKSKGILVLTFLLLLSVVLIIGSQFLGKVLSPISAVILFELLFSFLVIPSIVNNYYKLYEYEPPSILVRYCPFWNMTKIMNPISARLSIYSFIIVVLLLLLSRNITVLGFLGQRLFLVIVDLIPMLVFLSAVLHFIFIGIGLGGVSISVKALYSRYFEEDRNDLDGFFKVLGKALSGSKYIEIILFALPVFRIIPALNLMDNCSELTRCGATFDDIVDSHDTYDGEDEYEYDEYDEE